MKPKPSPPQRVEDLTALDIRVMEALTASRVTVSTVALAATIWTPGDQTLGADPTGLVEYIVTGLAERGLLTYRLEPRGQGIPNAWSDLPHTIRLTRDGWALMGYPNKAYQVGTRQATSITLDPKGDRTNFRKHGHSAEGVGPIEKLPWPEHKARYPHHYHPLMEDDDMTDATRPYVRVTPDLEAKVIAYKTREPLADYQTIADRAGLTERQVKYILVDLPRLRAANGEPKEGGIKQRILWVLDALPMQDVAELRRVLGRADTEHDIVHALHDLHTQGKVDFREDGPRKHPVNIRLTARGRGEGLPKSVKDRIHEDFKDATPEPFVTQAVADAELDEAEQTEGAHTVKPAPEAEPSAQPETYPLLEALIAREQERLRADNTYFKFSEAADLIREVDPEAAKMLDEKARQHDIPFPSPLEAEYLRFHQNCPMKVVERE